MADSEDASTRPAYAISIAQQVKALLVLVCLQCAIRAVLQLPVLHLIAGMGTGAHLCLQRIDKRRELLLQRRLFPLAHPTGPKDAALTTQGTALLGSIFEPLDPRICFCSRRRSLPFVEIRPWCCYEVGTG